jgi:membrane protease YdiL (CAAX protease family)
MRQNFIIIGLYVLGSFLAALPYYLISYVTPGFTDDYQIVAFIVVYVTTLLLLGYHIVKELKLNLRPFLSNWKNNIRLIVIIFFSAYFISILANIILTLLNVTEEAENQGGLIAMLEHGSTLEIVLLVLFFCLFVPLIEEIVFRKAFYGIIKQVASKFVFIHSISDEEKIHKYASIVAIIGSGLIFGLIHIQGDYIYLLQYGALGLLIGVSYYVSKENIIVPIGFHIAQNTLATVTLLIAISTGTL